MARLPIIDKNVAVSQLQRNVPRLGWNLTVSGATKLPTCRGSGFSSLALANHSRHERRFCRGPSLHNGRLQFYSTPSDRASDFVPGWNSTTSSEVRIPGPSSEASLDTPPDPPSRPGASPVKPSVVEATLTEAAPEKTHPVGRHSKANPEGTRPEETRPEETRPEETRPEGTRPKKRRPKKRRPGEPEPNQGETEAQNTRHLLGQILRTVQRGLLPKITVKSNPPAYPSISPTWTVTISLDELGICSSGHASTGALAEIMAAANFENELNKPDINAQLESRPRVGIRHMNAADTISAYNVVLGRGDPNARVTSLVRKTNDTVFEAEICVAGRPVTKPVDTATKKCARGLANLSVAHKVVSGHPDLWSVGVENPFQPSITVDDAMVKSLRRFIDSAETYLSEDLLGAEDKNDAFLNDCLAGLPFSPSVGKMLVLGLITNNAEPTILFAALEQYASTLAPGTKAAKISDPDERQFQVKDDHVAHVFAFKHLRNALLRGRPSSLSKIRREADNPVAAFENFISPSGIIKHFSPTGLQSIDTAARSIEGKLMDAQLLTYERPSESMYGNVPGTTVSLGPEPYGGPYNWWDSATRVARRILQLSFGDNIARYGYQTLIPRSDPERRLDGRLVRDASPDVASIRPGDLKLYLREKGPLVLFSGGGHVSGSDGRPDTDIVARYFTPVSSSAAILSGKKVSLPTAEDSLSTPGCSTLILNDWLPILVKSEVPGDDLTSEQARDLLLEARDLLHRAIDRALVNFFLSPQVVERRMRRPDVRFYGLLKMLPAPASAPASAISDRHMSPAAVGDGKAVKRFSIASPYWMAHRERYPDLNAESPR